MRNGRFMWCLLSSLVLLTGCASRQTCETSTHEAAQPTAPAVASNTAAPAVTALPGPGRTPEFPPEERFEPYPYVREGGPNADGTYAVDVHPWSFMGSLEKGEGDCDANRAFSFASVKDVGVNAHRVSDPAAAPRCSHEVKRADSTSGPLVEWDATCIFEKDVVRVVSVRQLVVAEMPTQRGAGGSWLHTAKYSESVSFDGEVSKECHYVGQVGRRAAP